MILCCMEDTKVTFEFNGESITFYTNISYICEETNSTLHIRTSKNFTSSMILIKNQYLIKNSFNDNNLYEYISTHKEELDKQNDKGYTALMLACIDNKLNIVEILLKVGVDVNLQCVKGNNALMYACCYGTSAMVKMLIDAGADVNAQSKFMNTSLRVTVANKNDRKNIVKLLMDHGVNLKIISCGNLSGFEIICKFLDAKSITYCLDNHTYYGETDLIKCIKVTKHKQLVASYLAKILVDKVNQLSLY